MWTIHVYPQRWLHKLAMDPLAILQAEIAEKRKANISETSQVFSFANRSRKRWRTKTDIEEEQKQAYYAREREEEERKKRRVDEGAQCEKKSPLRHNISEQPKEIGSQEEKELDQKDDSENHVHPSHGAESTKEPPMTKGEVIARLRALKEPTTLFGESPWGRFNRMRELELGREDVSKGQWNVFQKKMREMKAKDAEDDMYHYIRATLPRANGQGRSGSNTAGAEPDGDKQTPTCKEDYVALQLRRYMRLWTSEIEAMSKEERRTNKGRSQVVTFEQTKDWLKPLYKLLRKKKLGKKILDALNNIFEAAAERQYIRASSLYFEQLAIGNAPWPMGATMVGIHARAAREKIGEDKIAHVMNDERTRKYIQAVKRLLTVAQRHHLLESSKTIA